jgi:hypothetical protein
VAAMARNCLHLRVVDLELMSKVTDAGIQDLCHSLPNLASLNVGGTQVTNVGFQIIGERCTALRHISAAGCIQITDLGVSDVCKCLELLELSLRSKSYSATFCHLYQIRECIFLNKYTFIFGSNLFHSYLSISKINSLANVTFS